MQDSVDKDQTARSVQSDLGLHCSKENRMLHFSLPCFIGPSVEKGVRACHHKKVFLKKSYFPFTIFVRFFFLLFSNFKIILYFLLQIV